MCFAKRPEKGFHSQCLSNCLRTLGMDSQMWLEIQVHIYSLLPSCPTFLSCLIAKLLSLWTAPFVCTEWVLQCLLHKINSCVKTKLHANSWIFCRVFTPALPLPFSTVVLNSRTASAAQLLSGSDFSHILLHSMHVGRKRKYPYFSLM